MNSRSEKTRLAAVLRASEILLEHQRGEERAAIAVERAAARRAEAEANRLVPTQAPVSETPEEAAERLIASIRQTGVAISE